LQPEWNWDTLSFFGSIAYAVSGGHWGLYQTADGKEECPDGVNDVV